VWDEQLLVVFIANKWYPTVHTGGLSVFQVKERYMLEMLLSASLHSRYGIVWV
jgi:hypothetical protein